MRAMGGPEGASNKDSGINKSWRSGKDEKVVGLKNHSEHAKRRQLLQRSLVCSTSRGKSGGSSATTTAAAGGGGGGGEPTRFSVEEMEEEVRKRALKNPFKLLFLGSTAALKVLFYYLVTLETLISSALTVGLTVYWYTAYDEDSNWYGGSIDFVLLVFALVLPLSAALTMAFQRRERALILIADFRSWSYHTYLAHSLWDWNDNGGRAKADVNWVKHCDAVMAQLIGIGDELARFLSLPTSSLSRHRMTRQGRNEAARTVGAAYHLLESMATQRLTRLVVYTERLKKSGFPSGEASRLWQYERFLSGVIENLRMIKMYRTPEAFRSFARIFTLILPPFYAPTFAQAAKDVNSLGVGIAFGVIAVVGLTALFESLQILEDPFTAFLALDGIDVHEEFEVLHYAQLVNTRKLVFPDAPPYPAGRRAALTVRSKKPGKLYTDGLPPMRQTHHLESRDSGFLTLDKLPTIEFTRQTKHLEHIELALDDTESTEELASFDDIEDLEHGTSMNIQANVIRKSSYVIDSDDHATSTFGTTMCSPNDDLDGQDGSLHCGCFYN